jgi:RND family efflux transporter MFP subunit
MAVAAGCSSAGSPDAQTGAVLPVATATAKQSSFRTPLELAGTVTSRSRADVGAVTGGRVLSVDVRVGDRVSAGQVLARVDATQYAAQLAGALAGASAAGENVAAAQAQVEQARSRLRLAQITGGRMSTLYSQGAISRQRYDETQADISAAASRLAQARAGAMAASAQRTQAQAGVSAAGVPVGDATITAPFSGIITQRLADPGAVVGPGSPVVALEDTTDLELDVALPDDSAGGIVPGSPVRVRVDALGGLPSTGTILAIAPSDNAALRSATLRIALAPQPRLLPGMFARVELPGLSHVGVGVPLSAIVSRADQTGVFVVVGTIATFVPVQTLSVGGTLAEVQGIAPGARVAVSGLSQLTDGAVVRTTNT